MDLFEISLTFNELTFLRSALDPISIQGRDARFVASLQIKLEQEIEDVKRMLQEAETQKIESLQEAIKEDQKITKRPTKIQ
jgi:hypothetical protein